MSEIERAIIDIREFLNSPIGDGDLHIESVEFALQALQEKADRDNPKPLTLDELKEMDGEPVWVMHGDKSGARWGIISISPVGICAVVDDDTAYWFTDICKNIAYRYKPKEGDK